MRLAKGDAGAQLDIVMNHIPAGIDSANGYRLVENKTRGRTHQGESFGNDIGDSRAVGQHIFQFGRFIFKVRLAKSVKFPFKGLYFADCFCRFPKKISVL